MPRILCLHGSGANSEIMENQVASLRSMLPPTYVFDFLDAPLQCEAAAELEGVYPGPYYCFFQKYSEEEMQKALKFLDEVIKEDGPFDCVMGFSQGASVAAAYVAQQQLKTSFEDAPFKVAVFLCAALVPPQNVTNEPFLNEIETLSLIDVPTVHVIGRKDLCQVQSLGLAKSCAPSMAQVLLSECGHDVPRDAISTKQIAIGIERALRLAFSG